MVYNMILRRICGICVGVFLLCASASVYAQQSAQTIPSKSAFSNSTEDNPLFQTIAWASSPYVEKYEMRLRDDTNKEIFKTQTQDTQIVLSLKPGIYTFKIISYNILGQAESESAWKTLVIEKTDIPRLDSLSVHKVLITENGTMEPELVHASGMFFTKDVQVVLSASGNPSQIIAQGIIESFSSSTIAFRFITSDIESGEYDVHIINPGNFSASLPFAVEFAPLPLPPVLTLETQPLTLEMPVLTLETSNEVIEPESTVAEIPISTPESFIADSETPVSDILMQNMPAPVENTSSTDVLEESALTLSETASVEVAKPEKKNTRKTMTDVFINPMTIVSIGFAQNFYLDNTIPAPLYVSPTVCGTDWGTFFVPMGVEIDFLFFANKKARTSFIMELSGSYTYAESIYTRNHMTVLKNMYGAQIRYDEYGSFIYKLGYGIVINSVNIYADNTHRIQTRIPLLLGIGTHLQVFSSWSILFGLEYGYIINDMVGSKHIVHTFVSIGYRF